MALAHAGLPADEQGFHMIPRSVFKMVLRELGDYFGLGLVVQETDKFSPCVPARRENDHRHTDNADAEKSQDQFGGNRAHGLYSLRNR